MSFARVVDAFFVGNAPVLLWLVGVAALGGVVAPREVGRWFMPVLWLSIVPLAWAVRLDFLFFREVMQRPTGGAVRDVVLHRVITWSGVLAYFLGIAIWSELPKLAAWWASLWP